MGPALKRLVYPCVVAAALLSGAEGRAYVQTVTSAGIPVRWKGPPKLDLAGNPINASGLDAESFRAAVVRGLQRWQTASGGSVSFDYWQGTDPNIYVPDSKFDGLTTIYFASNSPSDNHLTANVLGLTQVWYDTSSGEILEADIVLNDRDFHFTTNERDTSGYGSGNTRFTGPRSNVFVENVITHELGHALGLSHSGGLQSTMLFMESPEQAHLGCDEQVAVHALYPSGDQGARGAIVGQVVSDSGPVFGAHVEAISRRRGTVLATGLSDARGNYAIGGLEPGTYYLMVEPFFAGPSTLPAYFSSMRDEVCSNGRTFGRTVLTDASGFTMLPVGVRAGASVAAPTAKVGCSGQGGGAAITSILSSSALSSSAGAVTVYDGSGGQPGFGVSDRFYGSETHTYRLQGVSGNLDLHVLSYSLYSPVRPAITLTDASGTQVPASPQETVYEGESGYVDYDTAITATSLPRGDYYLRVSGVALDASRYPAGPISLDSVPFLLVTGSVNQGEPSLVNVLSDNARCRMNENFADYISPPGNPPRHYSNPNSSSVGFCGTVQAAVSGGGDDSSGPGAGAILGWFLPWLFMALVARLAARWSRLRLPCPSAQG